jgi:hypothetical protein
MLWNRQPARWCPGEQPVDGRRDIPHRSATAGYPFNLDPIAERNVSRKTSDSQAPAELPVLGRIEFEQPNLPVISLLERFYLRHERQAGCALRAPDIEQNASPAD